MNTLRSRLILGFSLLAIIPLAVGMILLAGRVETTIREQSAGRLNAALGTLGSELAEDGLETAAKLSILARDPALRRLYLVRPAGSRDLTDYIEERRQLLGLDFLAVTDTSGAPVAEALRSASPRAERAPSPSFGAAPLAPSILSVEGAPALALSAGAAIRYQSDVAGVVRGGLVLDAAFLKRLAGTAGVELILRDGLGRAAASTLDDGPDVAVAIGERVERVVVSGGSYLGRSVPLAIGAPPHASIAALASTAAADRTVRTIQVASALIGLLGLGIAIVLGLAWSSQISGPVERLAAFSGRLARGEWDEPLAMNSVREIESLAAALDRMRTDLRSYRDRLRVSERQAAWGQMARKVAHEVKNPLTPIAISVADLRRSYEQQRPDFPAILDQAARTVADEVETLRRLLQEFSEFGRMPAPDIAPCRLADLAADLEALYAREIAAGRFALTRPLPDAVFPADRGQIRQALVNLIKNALEAVDGDGRVALSARVDGAIVEIAVSDTGPGLSAEQRGGLFVPGFTTKAGGSGLGLTIVERIVNDHQGSVAAEPEGGAAGRGTVFRIRLPLTPRS